MNTNQVFVDIKTSEIALNKYVTTTPGFVNMSKCEMRWKDGELTWNPPLDGKDEILDYSIHMAFKSEPATHTTRFVQIYCGPNNKCAILNSLLLSNYVHNVLTTDLIFRIAARNKKGYGQPKYSTFLKGEFIRNVHLQAEAARESYIDSMKHFDVTQQP